MYKVDIILPIYKATEKVFESIDSVINQTYKNWNLVIIDDASNDEMFNRIKDHFKDYNGKIKYIELTENKRAAGARNYAIKTMVGDFIAFLDQDDIWDIKKIEKQINTVIKTKAKACHTNLSFINSENNEIKKIQKLNENDFRNKINWNCIEQKKLTKILVKGCYIRLISSMVSREAFDDIGGFDDSLFGGEDWEFWVRFSSKFRIAHISEELFYRRENNLNTSKVYKFERQVSKLEALKKIKKANYFCDKKIIKLKEYQIYKSIIISAKKNEIKKVISILKEFVSLHPFNLKDNFKLIVHLIKKYVVI